MTLAFRKAERDDVPEIVRLLADDELGRTQEQGDGPIGGSYWNAFEAIDADPRQLLVVAEAEDGRILGTLQLSFITHMTFEGGTRAQIEGVRVDRAARGTGLGRRTSGTAAASMRRLDSWRAMKA